MADRSFNSFAIGRLFLLQIALWSQYQGQHQDGLSIIDNTPVSPKVTIAFELNLFLVKDHVFVAFHLDGTHSLEQDL